MNRRFTSLLFITVYSFGFSQSTEGLDAFVLEWMKDENYVQVLPFLKEGADQGDSEAQYYLGYCYQKGYGVEKDRTKALDLFTKSADQGSLKICSCGPCFTSKTFIA